MRGVESLTQRLPPADIRIEAAVGGSVEILRDRAGVPHVYAGTTPDLYFGLGLAISQWIAHAHSGRVAAQSRLGRGSVFTVTLPLA